jgi:F-type H+-transporting ATPase subunit O
MFGGSGNYASALYIAAVKANAAEKVDPEPAQFVESVKSSAITSQFIKDSKIKVMQYIGFELCIILCD